MEKNTQVPQEQDQSELILAKARKNKKTIVTCLVAAAVLLVGALAWIFAANSGERKAAELVGAADMAQNDSVATALYMEAAKAGYKGGNRARAMVGIKLYNEGEYEKALEYLDDASLDDNIAAAGIYTLRGDCHVNLDQLDKALSCYQKAVSKADKNPEIVPFVLIKEANIYREQKNYAAEAKAYKTIIDEYPSYVRNVRTDIRKYYERALAQQNAQ
ncbi:MAG: hypothetical protein K2L84_07385 [Muribaculaceae bacterium]|nr:hypothetical protein [Muribaculaceae bacterium]